MSPISEDELENIWLGKKKKSPKTCETDSLTFPASTDSAEPVNSSVWKAAVNYVPWTSYKKSQTECTAVQ